MENKGVATFLDFCICIQSLNMLTLLCFPTVFTKTLWTKLVGTKNQRKRLYCQRFCKRTPLNHCTVNVFARFWKRTLPNPCAWQRFSNRPSQTIVLGSILAIDLPKSLCLSALFSTTFQNPCACQRFFKGFGQPPLKNAALHIDFGRSFKKR